MHISGTLIALTNSAWLALSGSQGSCWVFQTEIPVPCGQRLETLGLWRLEAEPQHWWISSWSSVGERFQDPQAETVTVNMYAKVHVWCVPFHFELIQTGERPSDSISSCLRSTCVEHGKRFFLKKRNHQKKKQPSIKIKQQSLFLQPGPDLACGLHFGRP